MANATLAFDILTRYKDSGANKAAKDMDNLGKSGTRMGSSLKRAATVGAVGLAGGLVLAGRSLVGMTKSAIEDEAATKRLALALKNNAGATKGQVAAVESWITAQGKAYGVTDDDLRPALMKLVGATHDVGKAQKLASLAMDVSAGTGKSLSVVTQALMKAQNGQVAGLSKLGIKTQDSVKDQAALEAANIAVSKAQDNYNAALKKSGARVEGNQGRRRRARVPADQARRGAAQGEEDHDRLRRGPEAAGEDVRRPGVEAGQHPRGPHEAAEGPVGRGQGSHRLQADPGPHAALVALGVGLVVAYKKSETFRKIVNGALGAVQKVAKKVFGFVSTVATKTFGWLKTHWPLLLGILTGPFGLAVLVIVKNWDKITGGVRQAFRVIKDIVLRGTGWVVDKMLWMAEKVLDGAVSAFGWAPGIGSKLKAARDKIHDFRDGVNKELNGIRDENVKVTVRAGVTSTAGLGLHGGPGTGLAAGGPVTGGVPGRDSVAAWLMPGEHVLTTEEVRKAGGHGAIKAIRRMLKRGEFAKRGDVPAFAQGGPVFASSASSGNLADPIQGLATRTAAALAHAVEARVKKILAHLGGAGKLTPAEISRGQRFARSQVGDPYVWGGVGPNGFDCSGFVGAVLNAAQGKNPYSRRGTTGSMPWGGFHPGKGSFSVGWFTGNPGHMAGSIGGMGIESAGGVGVRVGGAARSLSSFPNVAHYDQGGWLQPGWTAAYNGTGKPERITAPHQDDLSEQMAAVLAELRGIKTQQGLIWQSLPAQIGSALGAEINSVSSRAARAGSRT
jgi:hypothetical protein